MIKPLSLCNENLVSIFMDMLMSRFMGLPESSIVSAKAWWSLLDGWHYKALIDYRNSGKIVHASFDMPEKELRWIFENKTT